MRPRRACSLCIELAAVLAVVALAAGCQGLQDAEAKLGVGSTSWWNPAKSAALRADLGSFVQEFGRLTADTADDISARTDHAQVMKACLLWKTRMIEQVQARVAERDRLVALLDTWALCRRQLIYLEGGPGSKLFGRYQPEAVAAARQALTLIERLASRYIPKDKIAPLQEQIERFARRHPIEGVFSARRPASLSFDTAVLNTVTSIIDIPLTPFTTVSSIEEGIGDLNVTAERLVGVAQDMPRQARWQTQVLLMALEQTPAVRAFVQSVQRLSEAPTALPGEVREQLDAFLRDIEKDPSCQSALRSIERISTLPTQTADQVDRILASVDRNPTAQSVVVSVAKVSTSAERLSRTAESLPEDLERTINNSAEVVQARAETLIDRASYRAAQLLLLGFALVVLLIVLLRLWRKRPAPIDDEPGPP